MSIPAHLHSYFTIIKAIRHKPYATQKELVQQVQSKLNTFREKDAKVEKGLAPSSFGRSLKTIHNLFGIHIRFNRKEKGYYIVEDGPPHHFVQEMMDSFELLQAVQAGPGWQASIQPEARQDAGRQHLAEILHAIRQQRQLQFTYLKHWDHQPTHRTVAPYLLKQAGQRWYVIAKEAGSPAPFKTFALDRMTDVFITHQPFDLPPHKPYEIYYQHTFGIDGPHGSANAEDANVQEVILSFVPPQGQYIKALPLHPTQDILADDETEFRIRLHVYLSWDLESEILSWGEEVKVLQPQKLADNIRSRLRLAQNAYTAKKEKEPADKI